MFVHRITITVIGFHKSEFEEGEADLVSEFTERPWLLHPQIWWNETQKTIVVQIDREEEDGDEDGEGTLDEVWDCILGTLNFKQKVQFSIESIDHIEHL